MVSAILLGPRRAPLGAPLRHLFGTGPRFQRPAVASPRKTMRRTVSQLLAGTRSGPGRSPGAARVAFCEKTARAPHPVPHPRTPHDAPFEGRSEAMIRARRAAGISFRNTLSSKGCISLTCDSGGSVMAQRRIPTLKVHQWLKAWESVRFSPRQHRRKPLPHFYLFSLPAAELRSLCGIAHRQAKDLTPRAADLGIQRQLDVERTAEIERFVEFGFPWSTLSPAKRKSPTYNNLRKPGWLPTAILVNILGPDDVRQNQKVSDRDLVSIDEKTSLLSLPYSTWNEEWEPSRVPPFEVIDGQHRLWAFGENWNTANFELPVVAFSGLDISWQAYLFWTINIKPKRINPSLAFDLYPLLRGEDWLDSDEAHSVYRETRSQELTEALWSHPDSPWYDRINMLGERQVPWVTQSSWIKSLLSTLVRPWEGKRSKMGGYSAHGFKRMVRF